MKVKITSIEQLEEISGVGAGVGQPIEGTVVDKKECQTETLLRTHIRNRITEIKRQQHLKEQQLRTVIKKYIKEAKDVANPHPSTGINKLRDAFRKAKPTIKSLFQQLTTSEEQRSSFVAHLLAAFVRLFDQLDAMNASGATPAEAADAAESGAEELAAPEAGVADEIEAELKDLLEAIDVEIEDNEEDEMDIVTADEEAEKPKSQIEKDIAKKKDQDSERSAFAAGLEGETTGRNQAFDAFRLTQSYFSDAYLDLADPSDKQMFKDWCLYNLDLLLKSFDEEIKPDIQKPEIHSPEGA
jgi:hypothetical protein